MKTTFKTIIAVSALTFGVLSSSATENNSALVSSKENIAESIDYRKEAQIITHWIADLAEAKTTRIIMERNVIAPIETSNYFGDAVENETIEETTDFRQEAQLMTKLFADKEEAKVTQKIMEKSFAIPSETISSFENEGENYSEIIDFRTEAQLMTRSIADMEEAKVTREVMEKAAVATNNAISFFENEVVVENNDNTTDFRAEAQLMTRLAADKEEAKAIQKLVAEGKLAVNN